MVKHLSLMRSEKHLYRGFLETVLNLSNIYYYLKNREEHVPEFCEKNSKICLGILI